MPRHTDLDTDLLRTFAAGFELGSFARAAEQLGRSPSAVSTRLRRLEEEVGQPLLAKSGRGLALTEAGETLLAYARRILALNDEAVEALRSGAVEGEVRLGLPQDFAEAWLPEVLGRFAQAHPKIRMDVRAERNATLVEKTRRGRLDLALVWGDPEERVAPGPLAERLASIPTHWIGRADWGEVAGPGGGALNLVAFEPPCVFRTAGLAALERAGLAWRVAFTSPSLAGLWAAAAAGFGITPRTAIGLPRSLMTLSPERSGLPALPPMPLWLHHAAVSPSPAVARLAEIVRETVSER